MHSLNKGSQTCYTDFIAAEVITVGKLVTSDGALFDPSDPTHSQKVLGIAFTGGGIGAHCLAITKGYYTLTAPLGSAGDLVYASTTGDLSLTEPTDEDTYSVLVGQLVDTDIITLDVQPGDYSARYALRERTYCEFKNTTDSSAQEIWTSETMVDGDEWWFDVKVLMKYADGSAGDSWHFEVTYTKETGQPPAATCEPTVLHDGVGSDLALPYFDPGADAVTLTIAGVEATSINWKAIVKAFPLRG